MKLLLVIDSLGSGGAQNQLTLLAKGLAERGHQIEIFTYFEPDFFAYRIKDLPIVWHKEQKSDKVGLKLIRKLTKLYQQKQYDSVISFLDTPNFYAAIAKKLSSHKPQLIISYRSMTNFKKLSKQQIWLKKWVNKTADIITANSHHERNRWIGSSGQADKWHTIYNAVDSDRFPPDEVAMLEDFQGKFLVVGSVGPAKNGLTVIEAVRILKERGIRIEINWVGQKMYTIKNRREYIIKMDAAIEAAAISDQWTWHSPSNQVAQFYMNSEALILASDREGLPNVVCEALSCGLPCLVSDILDHPLLVKDSKNGFTFPPEKPEILANKLEAFLRLKKEQKEQMSIEAKQSAFKLFDTDSFLDQYEGLLSNSSSI